MEALILYYTGAIAVISIVMEIIVKIDKAMDSWSLGDKFTVFGLEISIAQIIGSVLSAIASIVLTVQGGHPWGYVFAGWIAIYFTQYGAGKLGWRKIFELVIKVFGGK